MVSSMRLAMSGVPSARWWQNDKRPDASVPTSEGLQPKQVSYAQNGRRNWVQDWVQLKRKEWL